MADRQRKLIRPERCCCCCGGAAKFNGLTPGGFQMIAITGLMYRRGTGKGTIKATKNVCICESCLVLALCGSPGKQEGLKLFRALQERLTTLYNALRADDK